MRLFILLALAIPSLALASFSQWDANKKAAYSIEGKIKKIIYKNDSNQFYISFATTKNPGREELLEVCDKDNVSDARQLKQNQKMATMRDAFGRGDVVTVTYAGAFDRCLEDIEVARAN